MQSTNSFSYHLNDLKTPLRKERCFEAIRYPSNFLKVVSRYEITVAFDAALDENDKKSLCKTYKNFSFLLKSYRKTEILFCLSDIIHNNARIRFEEGGNMRITGAPDMDATFNKLLVTNLSTGEKVAKQGSAAGGTVSMSNAEQGQLLDHSEETKAKVQEAVDKMNEMLEVNHSASKFMYHEGLERYYVTVVNKDTDEIVKEIPPKKLLDAFYEMQKMLGMIVDEKI